MPGRDLPLLDTAAPRPERADAARNRGRVLTAAAQLFGARGIAAVSMDDIAAAAGVGKGTLYRRFGDKSGLAAALLDEREAALQAGLLTGPPPLGPGAPPAERLTAFVAAYIAFAIAHLDLVALSQTASPGARLRTGSHRLWRHHCRLLLEATGAPDPALRADALLAALTAEQLRHWLHDERRPAHELTRAIVALAESLTGEVDPSRRAGD